MNEVEREREREKYEYSAIQFSGLSAAAAERDEEGMADEAIEMNAILLIVVLVVINLFVISTNQHTATESIKAH